MYALGKRFLGWYSITARVHSVQVEDWKDVNIVALIVRIGFRGPLYYK